MSTVDLPPFEEAPFVSDVVIVGGCGRAGLPLGIAMAARGLSVVLYDINEIAVDAVNAGDMPFAERGATEQLPALVSAGTLHASADPASVHDAEHVIVVVGTPVDEYLNPVLGAVPDALRQCAPHLRPGQLVVLRSTVYPGVTALTERVLDGLGLGEVDVAFCPERIAEGKALTELFTLPQIVSGRRGRAVDRAEKLFRRLTEKIVQLTPEEAELAKLFSNTWRYIQFATVNQFWMLANDHGLDFERIRSGIQQDYPRAAGIPAPGFTAGPCLFKDTMQLSAYSGNSFALGHSAMLVNEGLPLYVVKRLEERYDLTTMRVGVLGTAFKGGSDDPRGSLAYKLRSVLAAKSGGVLCTDPYVDDDRLLPYEQVLRESDLLIIGAPHEQYRTVDTHKPVVDIWGLTGRGVLV